ncbi:MAG: glycosyltransferase [Anaerolineaceae bacterium]|nr:glycosyltransferase [Anaerolineaceae bacterium]
MINKSDISNISVIMPVYNGERYITEAIKSVLDQSYPVFEIIIIDDGSTDRTREIIDQYKDPVKYVYKEHSGLAATLNRGISEVQGEIISFLDADDIWSENKLELQTPLINDPRVDMVFGYMHQFISPELTEEEKSRIYCPDGPIPGYSSDLILVKKETLTQVGLFSANYQVGEFIDWYMRAKNLGLKSLMLPDVLVKRRLHKRNMTGQDTNTKMDYVRIIKANLDRRRDS